MDAELVGRLVEQARAAGLQLTGGLLQQLTKRVIEAALDGEITDLYDKGDPPSTTAITPATVAPAKRLVVR